MSHGQSGEIMNNDERLTKLHALSGEATRLAKEFFGPYGYSTSVWLDADGGFTIKIQPKDEDLLAAFEQEPEDQAIV